MYMYTYLHIHLIYYYKVICYQDKLTRSLEIILKVITSLIYKMPFLFKNRHYLLYTDIFENIFIGIKYKCVQKTVLTKQFNTILQKHFIFNYLPNKKCLRNS